MVSSVRRDGGVENLGDVRAWLRARPWVYTYSVLVLWAVVPGVRRVVDWKTAFSSVSIVSVVPLLALLPALWMLVLSSRGAKLGRVPLVAAWLWMGGFFYAYALGVASGNAVPASYSLVGFMLPMCFGLYVTTLETDAVALYARVTKFCLALSVPLSLYAIYQYVAPPPWDLYWIEQTGLVAVGKAAPFSFRTFSTLNGPGPFADFIVFVLALNFPRARGWNPLLLTAVAVDIAALGLTLVRSDWIALAIAVVAYLALSPHKVRNLSALAVFGIVLVFAGLSAASLSDNSPAGLALQSRFNSLTSVTTDSSYLDRQEFSRRAFADAISEPAGEGLGVVGTAAKLGASGVTANFDNGYIARLTEMGYFGTFAYLLTVAFMLGATLRAWWLAERRGDRANVSITAAVVAVQVALVFLDVSGDHHAQLAGLFFWLAFALAFVGTGGSPVATQKWR